MLNQNLINGLYARIDWLEFTITELDSELTSRKNAYNVLNLFGLHQDLFDEQGKGGLGYRDSLRHAYENIFVYFNGSAQMGVHVRCSGNSVTYLLKCYLETLSVDTPFGKGYDFSKRDEKQKFLDNIRKALGTYDDSLDDCNDILSLFLQRVLDFGHFTRIDLALDDVGANYFTVNDVFQCADNDLISCRFKKWQHVKSSEFSGKCDGHTVYFGSRESDVFLRVYEKAYEQKLEHVKWTRWELEIKHDKADLVAREIISSNIFGSVAIGILNNYMRILKDNNNKRLTRCESDTRWSAFVENFEKVKLKLPEKVRTYEDKFNWIETQCMPTLAGIITANGGDISFIRDNLESHFDRLKEKDKELFLSVLGGKDNDDR